MQKLIIEARVNEYAGRARNRHVPWTAAEIGADAASCFRAGASIVHFHVRKPDGGSDHAFENYRDTQLAIRANSGILTHMTLGVASLSAAATGRIAHIERLVEEGAAPDFAPMDMGSTNLAYLDEAGQYITATEGTIYQNSTATLRMFAEKFRQYGIKPLLQVWNISFMRQMETFYKLGLLDGPVFASLVCTDNECQSGHPGSPAGLKAFTDFLPRDVPAEWTVLNHGGSLLPLLRQIIEQGGHVSIGTGDYPYNELGEPTNGQLVEHVVKIARECGREIASPEETAAILKMKPQRSARPPAGTASQAAAVSA